MAVAFDDDVRDTPRRGLCFVCQRCGGAHSEAHDDPEVALRRAVEAGTLHTFHRCTHDGGTGLCRLVGTTCEHANAGEALRAGRERAA
jgi:hypothetical protein